METAHPTTRTTRSRGAYITAAVLAAGITLGIGELLAGLVERVPSTLSSIGAIVVDNVPTSIEQWAIDTFGTGDKAVLLIGMILTTLLIAAAVGNWMYRSGVVVAAPIFVGFGAVGLAASLNQTLISVPMTILAAVLTTGTGLYVLYWLLSTPTGSLTDTVVGAPTDGVPADLSRRQFVGRAAGVGAVAATSGLLGRRLLTATPRSTVTLPAAGTLPGPAPENFFPIDGLKEVVVPNDAFYRIDTALLVPRVSVDSWKLRIDGLVDNPLEFTFDDLAERDLVEEYITIACVSNPVGGSYVGNAKWTGVLLSELLTEARPTDEAEQVVGWSVDRWASGFPIEAVFDGREPLVAIAMNDEPLPARHGFPARLIVPGLYGYVSATKWLERIELTTWDGFDSYWVPRGWDKEGPIQTASRIDVPRRGERVQPGEVVAAGVAWAPLKGIASVEIQVDEGEWIEAELSEPLSAKAWVQWRAAVSVPEGDHTLRVRATDGTGEVQTPVERDSLPSAATGHHTIDIKARA
ncbi:MAG: molybdopterin-dependent oxidoreductase [Acidimicrobiia bacterium]|nr:molybdopterin-dependent oxidoreductase [Acidimicrobiia bacterium]NNL98030.1 molybdopterin-dependent oxidoreductase [Acidimicrobiia bacterium]